MTDKTAFFDCVRAHLFHGDIAQSQVDGLNYLLDTWYAHYSTFSNAYLAYCLATAYWETARAMMPVEEIGHGAGRPYGLTGYYGRGYCQITWQTNYRRATVMLKAKGVDCDLVAHPEQALDPVIAAHILFDGMLTGLFTGKKLANYLPSNPVQARRIINGLDHAQAVAGFYEVFLTALDLPAAPVAAAPVEPTPAPIASFVSAPLAAVLA